MNHSGQPRRYLDNAATSWPKPEAVLAAAEKGTEPAVRNQRCYAHLYLGLHAEACGRDDDAKRHMRLAAGPYAMDHFMGRIAQLHVRLRGWNEP